MTRTRKDFWFKNKKIEKRTNIKYKIKKLIRIWDYLYRTTYTPIPIAYHNNSVFISKNKRQWKSQNCTEKRGSRRRKWKLVEVYVLESGQSRWEWEGSVYWYLTGEDWANRICFYQRLLIILCIWSWGLDFSKPSPICTHHTLETNYFWFVC